MVADLEYNEPNMFFWIPEDASEETKHRMMNDYVARGFRQLGSAKNGGWTPVDPGQGKRHAVTLIPVDGVPPNHALYKEGHVPVLMRAKKFHYHPITKDYGGNVYMVDGKPHMRCNRIKFQRPNRQNRALHMNTKTALDMYRKGLFNPLGYDSEEERIAFEEVASQPRRRPKLAGNRDRDVITYGDEL